MNQRAAIVAAYCLMCAIWGTTWLGIKISLGYLPPVAGAGLRFVVAGLIFYGIAFSARAVPPVRETPWKQIVVFAIFLFGLNYVLNYVAETHVSSGLVAVLFGTTPFFIFGFGHFLIGERTTPMTWLGAAVAFAGVAIISLAANVGGSVWFALAAIGAAVSAAYANVYAKQHSHHEPLVTLPPSMLLSGIVMTIIGFLFEHPNPARAFSLPSWGAIFYLAIAGSCIAFFMNLWLLKRIQAWVVGMSALIIPVLAVIVGVAFGGETFGLRELAGAALVIAGVWLAMSKREPRSKTA